MPRSPAAEKAGPWVFLQGCGFYVHLGVVEGSAEFVGCAEIFGPGSSTPIVASSLQHSLETHSNPTEQ